MTRSKLEFATILASLRADGSDPQKLASEMSLRKLCYEIEKIEAAQEAAAAEQTAEATAPPPPSDTEAKKKKYRIKPFWAFLTLESSDEE
jgi:hypothetical protein